MTEPSNFDTGEFVKLGKKIVGVGRNYKDPNKPVPKSPILFFKPTTSYLREGGQIKVPHGCTDIHYEVELGVVIGQTASHVTEAEALDHVAGYAVCLDMTAWAYQRAETSNVQPWALIKGFDTACPVSKFIPKDKLTNLSNVRLWLKYNDELKQDDTTANMIFRVEELVSYISKYFTLEPGDMILTGSPPGSGPVTHGDYIEAGLDECGVNIVTSKFTVLSLHTLGSN